MRELIACLAVLLTLHSKSSRLAQLLMLCVTSPGGRGARCEEEGEIRVIGIHSETLAAGSLQICAGREWRAVCDGEWGIPEAAVACRELGFDLGETSVIDVMIALHSTTNTPTTHKTQLWRAQVHVWGRVGLALGQLSLSVPGRRKSWLVASSEVLTSAAARTQDSCVVSRVVVGPTTPNTTTVALPGMWSSTGSSRRDTKMPTN